MKQWYMLTVVGADRPGIVAALTDALFRGGCNLGEASMVRLGGNFTIMLMVEAELDLARVRALTDSVARSLGLHVHIDAIQAQLYAHPEPNVQVVVHGADRTGIVAQVTGALARAGVNILDLESEIGGTPDHPIYVMVLEGYAGGGVAAVQAALDAVRAGGIEAQVTPIDALLG
jgi:glycine cleavage system transcriptional repressor